MSDIKTVHIVTNPELGWDCIVEVFESLSDAEDLVEELGEPNMVHSTIRVTRPHHKEEK